MIFHSFLNNDLTRFVCKCTEFNLKVMDKIRKNVGDYNPPWWYNPHIGALIPLGKYHDLAFETEILNYDDIHFPIHWYPFNPIKKKVEDVDGGIKIILYFPGHGQKITSNVIQSFSKVAASKNFWVCVIGIRGMSVPLTSPKFTHPGLLDDAQAVLHHFKTHFHIPIYLFAAGFSAGTNLLQTTILHNNTGLQILGAVCVCCNVDYGKARDNIESTFIGRFYSWVLVSIFKDIVIQNSHMHKHFGGSAMLTAELDACSYISEYDKKFASIIHGFENDDDLCKRCSPLLNYTEFELPLLILQSRDDPLHGDFIDENLCVDQLTTNKNIVYMETKYGNHFGYYEGSLFDAFSNNESYTYPAKVATTLFDLIIDDTIKTK